VTRNRKPLEGPASFGATWELRFGPKNSFRVFYNVIDEEKIVSVLAIGVKEGNQLFIGGQEFEL
jgi:mRNA-degrading endonuclease RelE of RelBE toxin-antitoxin system